MTRYLAGTMSGDGTVRRIGSFFGPASATLTFWDAATGGNQLACSTDAAGANPVTSVASDDNGLWQVYYPDGVTRAWVDDGDPTTPRILVVAGEAVADAVTAAAGSASDASTSATAAANSATAAQNAAASVPATTDAAVAPLVPSSSGSATAAALSTAYVGRASSLAVAADTPGLPIAVPSGDIQWTATPFNFRPRGIGCDGYHYFTYLNTLIVRSTDPTLAVRTSGPEFNAASGPKPIRYVTKTSAGWVCIQDDASDTGQIRFCPNSAGFSTNVADWAVVATTKAFTGISIAKPVLVNGQHWLIAGEYLTGSYPSAARSLWLSTDGGKTWASIKSSQVVDSNVNSHWHTALIEPSGRIWASQGDGVNNWLGYTDDQGASWVPVPFGSNPLASGNTYMQPTRMVGFPTEIAAVPDDTNTAGVWALDPDTGVLTVRDNLPSGEQAFGQYGAGSVQRGREAYISFPDQGSGSGKTYIMGTGDYGRTWHLVSTIDGNVLDPIVGIDGNNQIYVQPGASIPTYGSHMMIGALPTWSWQTQ